MFALQAVAVGDEILFDYGYGLNSFFHSLSDTDFLLKGRVSLSASS